MTRVNNCLLDPSKITAAWQDEKDINVVTVLFDNGEKVIFRGAEAAELWRLLDEDKGWQEK